MAIDKDNQIVYDKNDGEGQYEDFQIDDTNSRLMFHNSQSNKLPPLKLGLERLKIDKKMLYNNVKKE